MPGPVADTLILEPADGGPLDTVVFTPRVRTDSSRFPNQLRPWREDATRRSGGGLMPFSFPVPNEPDSAWIAQPFWHERAAAVVADRLVAAPLGTSWTAMRGVPPLDTCEAFQPQAESSLETQWVYRCRSALAGGKVESVTYFVHDAAEPTLERVRWSFPLPRDLGALPALPPASALRRRAPPMREVSRNIPALDAHSVASFHGALVDTLRSRLGSARLVHGDSAIVFSFGTTDSLLEFATKTGVLRVYAAGGWEFPGLVAEHLSAQLDQAIGANLARHGALGSDAWPAVQSDDTGFPARDRDEARASLARKWPDVAHALGGSSSSLEDLATVRRALALAREEDSRARLSREDRDLLVWAAHLWLWSFADGGGRGVVPDGAKDAIEAALSPLGVRLSHVHLAGSWNYCGSLLGPLADRAGTNAWTDRALAGYLALGADTTCRCREDPDDFRRVIQRGESFLQARRGPTGRPNSRSNLLIAYYVAQAHETGWSLAKAPADNVPSIDPWRYVLDAPAHRERALELYRMILAAQPEGWNVQAIRHRVQRLSIDVDTGQRAFFCIEGD